MVGCWGGLFGRYITSVALCQVYISDANRRWWKSVYRPRPVSVVLHCRMQMPRPNGSSSKGCEIVVSLTTNYTPFFTIVKSRREKSFELRSMPVVMRMVHAQTTVRGSNRILTYKGQHSWRRHARICVRGAGTAVTVGDCRRGQCVHVITPKRFGGQLQCIRTAAVNYGAARPYAGQVRPMPPRANRCRFLFRIAGEAILKHRRIAVG